MKNKYTYLYNRTHMYIIIYYDKRPTETVVWASVFYNIYTMQYYCARGVCVKQKIIQVDLHIIAAVVCRRVEVVAVVVIVLQERYCGGGGGQVLQTVYSDAYGHGVVIETSSRGNLSYTARARGSKTRLVDGPCRLEARAVYSRGRATSPPPTVRRTNDTV